MASPTSARPHWCGTASPGASLHQWCAVSPRGCPYAPLARRRSEPLHNAIVWQDTRTKDLCGELSAAHPLGKERARECTGLPLSPYFSGSKLCWLLDNVPGLREAAEGGRALFGTIDSWLVWKLTGGPDGGVHITGAREGRLAV